MEFKLKVIDILQCPICREIKHKSEFSRVVTSEYFEKEGNTRSFFYWRSDDMEDKITKTRKQLLREYKDKNLNQQLFLNNLTILKFYIPITYPHYFIVSIV